MPDPIVFISHGKIKERKLEELEEMSEKMFPVLEAEKPGTVLHYGYLDADGSQVHFVHVFPGPDAMDAHMEGAGQRTESMSGLIETTAFEVYGIPSDAVVEALSQNPSVELTIRPGGLGGYIRLGA